jgi:hypothetical protein
LNNPSTACGVVNVSGIESIEMADSAALREKIESALAGSIR